MTLISYTLLLRLTSLCKGNDIVFLTGDSGEKRPDLDLFGDNGCDYYN